MKYARAIFRLIRLGLTLGRGAARITLAGRDPVEAVQETAARIARVMNVDLRILGTPPNRGLVVSNHLGYLDIVVLAATAPSVFVAKSEIRRWPVFGWFARRSGCIFVDRESSASAGRSVRAIRAALNRGRRVILFPEGTSSGGAGVLPFRSSLLEPAVGQPLTIAAVRYGLDPG